MDDLMAALFLESFADTPSELILDIDATDVPLHGEQEVRFITGIMGIIVICRSIFSVMNTCCAPACAQPIRIMPLNATNLSGTIVTSEIKNASAVLDRLQ